MKKEYLEFMCCPSCTHDIIISEEAELENDRIKTGVLKCSNNTCEGQWNIRNCIPRFTEYGKYANSFGDQWNTFAKTQLDDKITVESELRWQSEINWTEEDLKDKRIIEFGSGAGRFIDIVSNKKPKLAIGIDITDAVDASFNNLKHKDNVFFIQADFFSLPIKSQKIDFAYSIGVLHHTPNPEAAFKKMASTVRDNGEVGLCLYEVSLYHRPNRNSLKVATIDLLWSLNLWRCEFFRFFTTKVPDKIFLAYCKYFVPILHYINKIPVLRYLRYLFPSTCYRTLPVEWSMLDTNDTYATKIVHQYRHKDVFQWFLKEKLSNIMVHNSRAGWVSLTAVKTNDTSFNFEKYIHAAPGQPGV